MVEVQEGVTGGLKVSHIQSLYTAGVFLILSSGYMIWAWKRKEWLNFHFVSILSLGRKRMYLVKPPKDAHVECDKHMTNYVGKDAFHVWVWVHPFHVLYINKDALCAGDRLQIGAKCLSEAPRDFCKGKYWTCISVCSIQMDTTHKNPLEHSDQCKKKKKEGWRR